MRADITQTPVIALTQALVAINSINPALEPDAPGETELARFVADWCLARGCDVHWIEPVPGRPSVVAIARGKAPERGRSLMLNAHLDTVGVAGMPDAFSAHIADGFLHGRGACDMKASLAACMRALEAAASQDLAGDVLLTAVSDEEHGSIGTASVLERFQADAAIVTEPTGLQLCTAHRGFAVFDVTLTGKAAHTSQPALGANAVTALGRVLQAVEQRDAQLRATPHPLLQHASLQAVLVSGGSALFTLPEQASLSIERRTLPAETLPAIEAELAALLTQVLADMPGISATQRTVIHRAAFESAAGSAIVDSVEAALSATLGAARPRIGAPYWMDSGLIAEAGIPVVIIGPTGHGLHSAHERVDCAEVLQLEQILIQAAADFCR